MNIQPPVRKGKTPFPLQIVRAFVQTVVSAIPSSPIHHLAHALACLDERQAGRPQFGAPEAQRSNPRGWSAWTSWRGSLDLDAPRVQPITCVSGQSHSAAAAWSVYETDVNTELRPRPRRRQQGTSWSGIKYRRAQAAGRLCICSLTATIRTFIRRPLETSLSTSEVRGRK